MTLDQTVLAAGAGAFVFSLLLTPAVRAFARSRGFVDEPGPRKIHAHPVALGGGVAIFGAVFLPLAAGLFAVWFLPGALASAAPGLAEHIAGARSVAWKATAYLLGALAVFVLGLVDDAKGLGPRVKLLSQVAIGIWLSANDIRLSSFLDRYGTAGAMHYAVVALQTALTVGWFVVVTNSLNLLDNMDGLAAGVASAAAVSFGLIALSTGQTFIALALFTLLGGTLGFLAYNRPPATVFMGDAGSLTLGYHLSVLTILFKFYDGHHPLAVYFVPLLVLAVPLYDTFSVILIRLRLGKPIMVGDNNHFSHRLVALGLSRPAAIGLIVLLTCVTGLSAILLYRTDLMGSVIAFVQTGLVLTIVAVLEIAGRKK
ncbi:MAG: undecaprenyl/decaprenyl-phosphate alpha-N-acetylglucosaminyl 1-phosphate transferase [Planctomycetes bacterium]|nr:undecaprenyl/decaprenyl-phosphate alpha-N-acetylglucosaminyl 1-phosphate transferase [Planctomycetota bacterium]